MTTNKSFGDWKLFDFLQFINKLYLSLQFDAPLELVLRFLFSSVLGKLMCQCKCTSGIQLFPNFFGDIKCEIYHLYLDKTGPHRDFLKTILEYRHVGWEKTSNLKPPSFVYYSTDSGLNVRGLKDVINNTLLSNNLTYTSSDVLRSIIEALNEKRKILRASEKEKFPSDSSKLLENYAEIECVSKNVLVIPLNKTNFKLGLLILWNNQQVDQIELWEAMEKEILITSKILQNSIVELLTNHYQITPETYLPCYRQEGPNEVAILFADIRNFTTVTEIARNRGFHNELQDLMYKYFDTMTKIIEKWEGRVEKLAGDSIMGLWGEYDKNRSKVVGYAVAAASEMYAGFETIKADFLSKTKIENFLKNSNEPLEFDLGIGINYGEALFGYFGKHGARQYMALGDHVNFAQRLESISSRFDSSFGRNLSPILLSRTAYNSINDYLININNQSIIPQMIPVSLKGKSFEYPIYEVFPSSLRNTNKYSSSCAFLDADKLLKKFPLQ